MIEPNTRFLGAFGADLRGDVLALPDDGFTSAQTVDDFVRLVGSDAWTDPTPGLSFPDAVEGGLDRLGDELLLNEDAFDGTISSIRVLVGQPPETTPLGRFDYFDDSTCCRTGRSWSIRTAIRTTCACSADVRRPPRARCQIGGPIRRSLRCAQDRAGTEI